MKTERKSCLKFLAAFFIKAHSFFQDLAVLEICPHYKPYTFTENMRTQVGHAINSGPEPMRLMLDKGLLNIPLASLVDHGEEGKEHMITDPV